MAWTKFNRFSSLLHLGRQRSQLETSGNTQECAIEAAGASNSSSTLSAYEAKSRVQLAILIPAYRPNHALIDVVTELQFGRWAGIFVVDDGSGPEYAAIFDQVSTLRQVTVTSHALNMGKGAALKTGINQILCKFPNLDGVLTVDADGQHAPNDVRRVADRFRANPSALVLGARSFDGPVPLRSRVGNQLTKVVLRLVLGCDLTDTQTGLRAIPKTLLPRLLKVDARGYEFELETLVAAKHCGTPILQEPILTIYEPGNPTSHFKPLRDSMKIYFVLLRFTLISISTAILDNLVFLGSLHLTGNVLASQLAARTATVFYAYPLIRRAVFLSEERHNILFPRYVFLVAVNAVISYTCLESLIHFLPIGVFPAKIAVEALMFLGNFVIQRDWIFTRCDKRHASVRSQDESLRRA